MEKIREYKVYYIAYLDLLGFKNTIINKKCEDIAKYFDEIKQEYITTVNETNKPLFDHRRLKKVIMSDSICFFIEVGVKNAFAGLVSFCNFFQVRMASLKEPVLVRGAIVKGELYNNKTILFGPGLVEAYLMEERTAKFPRIIFVKSLLNTLQNFDEYGKNYVRQFTYMDMDEFCVIDFLYLFYGMRHEKNEWKSFANHIKLKLETETDAAIREKYLYLWKDFPRAKEKFLEYLKENEYA